MSGEFGRYLILIDIDGGTESGDDLAISVDLPSGTLGAAYAGAYIATGGVPPYTYATSAGSLPTGLSLDVSTGLVTGTPTSLGSDDGYFEFTAAVTDSAVSPVTVSKVVSIRIGTGIVIAGVMPPAEDGIAYAAIVSATGGTPPYTWTIPSGSLPTGTTIGSGTGFISGTPSATGTFTFTVRATDSASVPQDFPASIVVAPAVDLSTSNYANGIVGIAYSAGPTRTGGVAPFTYSFTGTLPAGTNFDPRSGFVTGTPTSDNGGTPYAFDVIVLDVLGGTDTFSASVAITSGGGGGGSVNSVTGLVVDNTDPANPVVEVEGGLSLSIGRVDGPILSSATFRTFLVPAKYANASAWKMSCDPTATCSLDIWYRSFGATRPTAADSIVGGNYPAISGNVDSSGTTSGWTTTDFDQFAYITFYIRSNDFATEILFEFEATRTL